MNGFDLSTITGVYVGSTQYSSIYYGSTQIWSATPVQLPYDAEIEYLESYGPSSNNPYISTGMLNSDSTVVDIKMSVIGGNRMCGSENSGNNRFKWGTGGGGTLYYGYATSVNSTITPTLDTPYIFHFEKGTQWVADVNNNIINSSSNSIGSYSSIDIKLFACSLDNGNSLLTPNGTGGIRIYYCNITNSTKQMQLIPVRVGQVGYLYDKVSGQLFGNDGNGTFTLGPDVGGGGGSVEPEPEPEPEQSVLPSGYTQLQYIESTSNGSQYLDLNIKLYETLNTNYDIAIKFNIFGKGTDSSQTPAIFSCQNTSTSPWPGTFIRTEDSKGSNKVNGRWIGANQKDPLLGYINTDIELPVQTPPDKNVYSLNNSGQTHTYGTSLFCVFTDSNNTPGKFINARLYYFKLFVEGILVRDLVPGKNSSDVVGMYDLVNDVFYTSPNGAAFVAGPSI